MTTQIKNVAIIGLGLLGGSLGMAIKNKNLVERVVGIHYHEGPLEEALKKEAADEVSTNFADGTKEADIVFICTPINIIVPTLQKILPHLKAGAMVSDVGSTKAEIVREAEKIMPDGKFFIGGHPMAGSEKTGIGAASKFLFDNCKYILTPTENTTPAALESLKSFLEKLDIQIVILNPEEQDLLVAGISHLPLAISVSLVNTIGDMQKEKDQMLELAASGFRDTTRIASGSVVMGKDMFVTNKDAVLKMIERFKHTLSELEKKIKHGNADEITKELERAKQLRDCMYRLC
jgi:prephenate dehydrogenase